MTIDKDGKVGIGTTDLGTSKLKIANTASDFSNFQFAGAGMGQLLFVGWSSGWNINTQTDGKNLYLNRDSGANSNVLIGRNGKELFVRGSDGNVGIGSTTPADKLDINGVLRFNGNANRRVYGASRAGSDAVVLDGRWNELEVKGRVIDWTGSNLHIGYENDHSQDSVYIGNGKLKAVEIQGGTSLTVGGDLTVKGTIKGKVWYSKEYVWTQGSGPVRMTTTAKTICFLMSVRGKFEGGGEHVDVYPANGYWYLGGSSAQKDVRATARCIGMP